MSIDTPNFVKLEIPSQNKTTKPRYTEAERKDRVEAWQKSGLSINEYCRQSGVVLSTLCKWIKEFNVEGMKLPLYEEKTAPFNGRGIEVILNNGIRLRFGESVSLPEVIKLIKVLGCN